MRARVVYPGVYRARYTRTPDQDPYTHFPPALPTHGSRLLTGLGSRVPSPHWSRVRLLTGLGSRVCAGLGSVFD